MYFDTLGGDVPDCVFGLCRALVEMRRGGQQQNTFDCGIWLMTAKLAVTKLDPDFTTISLAPLASGATRKEIAVSLLTNSIPIKSFFCTI